MNKSDWIHVDRLHPPKNMRVLGYGRSNFNGKSGTMAVGFLNNETGDWILQDQELGIEGLREVRYWQHVKKPR